MGVVPNFNEFQALSNVTFTEKKSTPKILASEMINKYLNI